jgi:hypothetical protein
MKFSLKWRVEVLAAGHGRIQHIRSECAKISNALGIICIAMILSDARLVHSQPVPGKSIHVETVGDHTESATEESEKAACRKFKPTRTQIIKFFNLARPVEESMLVNERYSRCIATGSLIMSDGARGAWVLYSSGVATLDIPEKKTAVLFYGRNNWFDPWACTYGQNGEEC